MRNSTSSYAAIEWSVFRIWKSQVHISAQIPAIFNEFFSKMPVSWDDVPCNLVEIDDVSWVLSASVIALMTEAVRTSEKLLNFYQTTWYNIPGECHLHI
jgi:hypothetical protein